MTTLTGKLEISLHRLENMAEEDDWNNLQNLLVRCKLLEIERTTKTYENVENEVDLKTAFKFSFDNISSSETLSFELLRDDGLSVTTLALREFSIGEVAEWDETDRKMTLKSIFHEDEQKGFLCLSVSYESHTLDAPIVTPISSVPLFNSDSILKARVKVLEKQVQELTRHLTFLRTRETLHPMLKVPHLPLIMLRSVTSGKQLRVKADGKVDARGDRGPFAFFKLLVLVDNQVRLQSDSKRSRCVRLSNGEIDGLGGHGDLTVFYAHGLGDNMISFESQKYPNHYLAADNDGYVYVTMGDKIPDTRFRILLGQ